MDITIEASRRGALARHRRPRRSALSGLVALAVAAGVLAAVPAAAVVTGSLDPTFGTGGITRVDLGGASIDVANAGLSNPGGAETVLVGSANDRFALAGPATTPFGNARGQVVIDFGSPSAAYAAAAADDLVAVGRAGEDFAVARMTRFGNPVVGFGDQGRVTTSFGRPAVARGVALRIDDSFVVGTVGVGADADLALARYDSQGQLVPAFGDGGTVVADLSGGADAAYALRNVSRAGPGNLVVAGRAGGAVFVGRYLPDGTWDPTFGVDGRVLLDLTPGDDIAYGLAIRPDGQVIVAGTTGAGGFVARLTSAGLRDTTFGTDGLVSVDLGPGGGFSSVIVGQSSAREETVVVGGTIVTPSGTDGVLLRLTVTGQVDTGFGTAGRTVVDFGGAGDRGNGVVPQGTTSDGAVLVGGDGADMRLAAVDAAGQLVPPSAVVTGRIDFSTSSEWGEEIAVQPDGAIVVVGGGDPGLVVTRFRPDGRLDPTFGRSGVVVEPLGEGTAVALQADGKILVGGRRGTRQWGVYRLLADGRIDKDFGHLGFAGYDVSGLATVGGVVVRPDGHIVVGSTELLVVSPSGQIEASASLRDTGTEVVSGLAMEPDGVVVAVVRNRNEIVGTGGRAVRLLLDGTLDPYFGGAVRGAAGGVVRLPDGRFVFSGDYVTGRTPGGVPTGTDLVLTAMTPDGRNDDTFGGSEAGGPEARGIVTVDIGQYDHAPDLTVTPDGKVLVSFSFGADSTRLSGVARFLSDGRLDRSFASEGTWLGPLASWPTAVAVGANGRVLVAGRTDGSNLDVALVAVAPAADASGRPEAWGFGALGQLDVGSVWASGWNATGQLGDGTAVDRHAPVRVAGLSRIVAVAAGTYHSLALRDDGTVWAWGWNYFGQLGNGSTADSRTPVRVPGLTQVTAIAAGSHHNLALRSDGTAWGWGWNGVGQLGIGTTVDSRSPVRVSLPAVVSEIAAGSYHSLFLYDSNGTIAVAGWNEFGQLGTSTGPSLSPSVVDGSGSEQGRYVAIAGGGLHSLALKADGTVWTWGWNHFGELGNGTTVDSRLPVKVTGITNAAWVAGGAYHSLVLGRDGVARAFGWNGYGQLGTGGGDSAVPVVVATIPAATVVSGIAAGALHSSAF
jgi:uncharacterized delta-60 repeat protein